MPDLDPQTIAKNCERFLSGHGPRTVRQLLIEAADSELAQLKQDHYGNGGFVSELETGVAELLGKEAAVFMPSGTMAQQIALRLWCDEKGNQNIAFHPTCHLEIHEQKAYRELHGLKATLLGEPNRLFTIDDLKAVDQPVASLLIELPQREIGGQLPTWDELVEICAHAHDNGIRVHMDGARLWECGPYYGKPYSEITDLFDSVYVSFYKILGALPGAMLAGPKPYIDAARIWQRRHGGNLYQQSPNAILAKIGLDRHLPMIPEYVAKAAELAEVLSEFDQVEVVPKRPPTNMMHLHFKGDAAAITHAALQVAEETMVGLFFGLGASGKLEVSVGQSALGIGKDELRDLFTRLFELV